jgi:exosome complex component RRP40
MKKASNDLTIVLPGDNVTDHIAFPLNDASDVQLPKLGSGLRYDTVNKQVYATCPGSLERHRNRAVYYVEQNQLRRYRPAMEDRVVGIVENRAGPDGAGGDLYRINIGASHPAVLSNLQFEGASKRNKPAFQPGHLIYARVSALNNLLDPTLSCINGPHDTGVPRKDWMTNEGCYGELRGGTCCKITTNLARELLHPSNTVLAELATCKLAFEVAIGVNGFLWIHSAVSEHTILIQNAIQNSEVLTDTQVRAMVKSLVYMVEKQLQQQRDSVPEQD